MEGACETSGTWFRDCYQDAGIPCAFQVFRPFQPLHTLVSPPPPPDFWPSQAGWRVGIISRAALAPSLRIIPWTVQAQSDPTGPIVDGIIALEWDAPTENAEAVYGYQILRRRPNQGETTLTDLVPNTGSKALAYTDATAAEAGDTYAYQVKAIAIRGDVTSQNPNRVVVEADETSSVTDTENTVTTEVILSILLQRGPEARGVHDGRPERAFSFALSQPRRCLTGRGFTSWISFSAMRLDELVINRRCADRCSQGVSRQTGNVWKNSRTGRTSRLKGLILSNLLGTPLPVLITVVSSLDGT